MDAFTVKHFGSPPGSMTSQLSVLLQIILPAFRKFSYRSSETCDYMLDRCLRREGAAMHKGRGVGVFLSMALLFIAVPAIRAQLSGEAYKTERAQAMELVKDRKELEALPLFEELAKSNPDDAEVLANLGICLLHHSATLSDEAAAKQERVRVRGILTRAKQLGSTNGLVLNLLDLIPADGSAYHDARPDVDQAFQAGETAFSKHEYDEAIKNYQRTLELDPQNYSATLFVGDSYFAKKDFVQAQVWYDRAISVNPNIETAYRYEGDMLAKNGDAEKARIRFIQAVIAEPYQPIPWRALQAWAKANKLDLHAIHINTPQVSAEGKSNINITLNSGGLSSPGGSAWIIYSGVRANWRQKKFLEKYPREAQYRHTLAEELEALSTAASTLPKPGDAKSKELVDPGLVTLQALAQANMLEPYVLLNGADQGIAQDYSAYRETHRAELQEYLNRFVVPPAPAKP
jgi:tetratricopeptide (TPR) repeat protein